ncbi:MAG: MBL fold metallo-hydrolase, partial [Deltaproteobacteria bacterium]
MIEPLVRAVDDDLVRIRLAAPSGLVVNAYLLRAGDALALVDTGFSCTAPDLVAGLAEVGVQPADLTHVLYTHTHYDHIGGGAALAHSMDAEHVLPRGTGAFFRSFFTEAPRIPDYPEGISRLLPSDALGGPVVTQLREAPR